MKIKAWNYIKLMAYKVKIFIPQKLQKYIVKCYHMYLLHHGLDQTEAIVLQDLYWPSIRDTIQTKIKDGDDFQCTKISNKIK